MANWVFHRVQQQIQYILLPHWIWQQTVKLLIKNFNLKFGTWVFNSENFGK